MTSELKERINLFNDLFLWLYFVKAIGANPLFPNLKEPAVKFMKGYPLPIIQAINSRLDASKNAFEAARRASMKTNLFIEFWAEKKQHFDDFKKLVKEEMEKLTKIKDIKPTTQVLIVINSHKEGISINDMKVLKEGFGFMELISLIEDCLSYEWIDEKNGRYIITEKGKKKIESEIIKTSYERR